MIRACGLLAESAKSFQCEIIGEGPLENELRVQIDQLNLQDRVVLSGAKPQRGGPAASRRGERFVLPSVVDAAGRDGQSSHGDHGSDGDRITGRL